MCIYRGGEQEACVYIGEGDRRRVYRGGEQEACV